jgi:hypothetical protein
VGSGERPAGEIVEKDWHISSKHHQEGHWEGGKMDLWLVLFWTGPIGLGIFLAGLGVLFWGIAQARESEKKKE